MASTPSASSLSAVLRCRGNIWTRNAPSQQPSGPAHGPAHGLGRPGERVGVWRGLTLTLQWPGPDAGEATAGHRSRRSDNKLRHSSSNLSRGDGDARSRTLASHSPRTERFAALIRAGKHRTREAHAWKVPLVEEFPAACLKVSVRSACLLGHGGHVPCLVSSSWSALKSTCLSLTALVSQLVFWKLTELCRSSSSPDAPQRPLSKLDEAKGQIHNPAELSSTRDSSSSGQKITGDRPD